MRNFFASLQLFSAFFLTLLGLEELFRNPDPMQRIIAALLAALGLTFLSLLAVNIKK